MRFPIVLAVAVAAITLLTGSSAAAQTEGEAEAELARRYAPLIRIAAQDGPCDENGESFAPMSVDLVLDNEDVLLRQAGVGDPVVTRGPSAADLFGRGEGFFLDFNGQSLSPGCVYERDFDAYSSGESALVYAHVVAQPDRPGKLALQFWLYWYYNDWNNKHESDWEFVQLLFDAEDAEQALRVGPTSVGYAQHEGGERSDWDDGALERIGDRPVVYSSRGSHASYFESAVFLGRRGTEGFGCDTTANETVELDPDVAVLPDSVEGPDDPFAWLAFTGRWGERGSGPFNGPTGPNTKDQWSRPIDWHDDLRGASVEIPGGDETNDTVLDTFCSVVNFGSDQLRQFQVSPTRTLVLGALAFLGIRFLVAQTDWSRQPPTPLRRRRRVGQMLRGAFGAYVSSRGALAVFAGLYLPLAVIVALVGWIDSFGAAQSVAAVFTSVMAFFMTASVSAYWHLESADHDESIIEAMRLVRRRLWSLLWTTGLSAAIVVILALTVVGLPLAVRQLIRYQFIVPVVVTEELTGRAALRRSGELVEGRWWRTLFTLVVLFGVAFLINSALQLGLLVALGSLPLWTFVALTFLTTGLLVPMVSTGPALLYGDAAAPRTESS
ncbi:MAG: hypothetical protein AB8G26_15615 [Ilumatobacter sp.]